MPMEVAGADTAVDGNDAVSPVYENQVQYRWIDLATSTGKEIHNYGRKTRLDLAIEPNRTCMCFGSFVDHNFSHT